MATRWYNVAADLLTPLDPPLNPQTGEVIDPKDLEVIFPRELIRQEMSTERWIDIPDEVREILKLWRPTPLFRAHRLEAHLKTPAKIYYKYEGVSPAGSHKPNTAVAQAYYNREAGIKRILRFQDHIPGWGPSDKKQRSGKGRKGKLRSFS